MLSRRGPGLRLRLTLLAAGLVALVSGLLLWLGWVLVGNVAAAVPQLPSGTRVRVHGVEVPGEMLGEALRESAQRQVLVTGGFAFVAVVVAAGLLAWTLTGRLLRPVHEVTATARQLSVESMDERIQLSGPRDEVAELADTFNAMLDRLQAAFESQRRFVANASHELRTPLAVIQTELDVTLSDPDADSAELRRMAEVVREAAAKSDRLVESLLLLARTEGARLAVVELVDLKSIVDKSWRVVSEEARQRGLRVTRRERTAVVSGDPDLLERIAGNLLENAVRHNVDGGWIETSVQSDSDWVELRVAASGAPVSPSEVETLFEPFRRAGVQRTARTGSGLGLSIVRAAVEAHHGQVDAEALPDGGLVVTVRLPAAP
ncbi:histidine kinase [Saccharopolyspora rectivirgula]|uniref:histidine kinase n=1 Tax=Saccharopolyspora rectivirgula TaxID=28042 RepID=A0A073B3S3_9PSEU|nr:histidine kinase [Saccharopolyspora rectivirgula]